MATAFYNTPVEHSNDATFRLWGDALSTAIQTVGLIQTADTGQINWGTVLRPGVNTAGGYEIFRFDDTLQGASPIFLKLEYGTANVATYPQMWATVGTGSDGAGNITGTQSTRTIIAVQAVLTSTVLSYPTYLCADEGAFWFSWKIGSNSAAVKACFAIFRSVAATGNPNSDGFTVYHANNTNANSTTAFAISNLNSTTYTSTTGQASFVPFGLITSTVGVTPQVFKHYTITPRVRPNPFPLTCRSETEIPQFNQFLATVVGGVQRNYIALGVNGSGNQYANLSSTHAAMVYQ